MIYDPEDKRYSLPKQLFYIGVASIVLALLLIPVAFGDDGTWNAGASRNLPNSTGGDAQSQGQNSSVICSGGRCATPRSR